MIAEWLDKTNHLPNEETVITATCGILDCPNDSTVNECVRNRWGTYRTQTGARVIMGETAEYQRLQDTSEPDYQNSPSDDEEVDKFLLRKRK